MTISFFANEERAADIIQAIELKFSIGPFFWKQRDDLFSTSFKIYYEVPDDQAEQFKQFVNQIKLK